MSELKEVIQELNEVSVYLAEIGNPVKANKVNNAVAELRKYSELTKRVEAFAKWVPNSRPVDPKIMIAEGLEGLRLNEEFQQEIQKVIDAWGYHLDVGVFLDALNEVCKPEQEG